MFHITEIEVRQVIIRLAALSIILWVTAGHRKGGPVPLFLSLWVWLHSICNGPNVPRLIRVRDASLVNVLKRYEVSNLSKYLRHVSASGLRYCFKVVDGHGLPEITNAINEAMARKR